MTKRVFNMGGGAHSDAAYTAFENAAYGSCVASPSSLAVSTGGGMSVRISAGDGIISTPNSGKRIQSDAVETVTISPANATYQRIDSVVAYIDNAVQPSTAVIDNTNGILKFAAVAGTPAASPTAPSESMIQAGIGAGNRYMVLADVRVPAGVTSMNTASVIDRRKVITVVSAAQIPDDSISASKIKLDTFPAHQFSTAEQYTGRKWINGKKIYQRTYAMGGLPNASALRVAHGIGDLDLVIRIQGIAKENSVGATINLPHAADQQPYMVTVYADNTNVNIQTYTNQTGYTQSFVTLYYTKK